MSLLAITQRPDFLRRILLVDATLSTITALAMLLATGPLASLTALPVEVLRGAGFALLPFVAFVFWLASRETIARGAVWLVIAINVLWVVDSIALLFGGWVNPNAFGYAFVLAQALVVAVLAELEYMALRRSPLVYA